MVGLAWVKLLPFAVPQLQAEKALILNEGEIYWVQNGAQGGAQSTRDSNSLQCFRCQGWGHMARECATPAKMLNQEGGTQGNAVKPPPATISKFTTFPLWSQTKTDPSKGSEQEKDGRESLPSSISKSRPSCMHLVGHANEVPVVIDG